MEWREFSLIDLEALTTPKILERGREYLNEGHLQNPCVIGNVLAGVLIGAHGNYKARLWINGTEILWECSCPYPDFCKHLAALAIAWVERKGIFYDLQPSITNLLDDIPKMQRIFQELVYRDPTRLMELILLDDSRAGAPLGFLTSRGILNLTRNVFQSLRMNPADMDSLSERIARVANLIFELADKSDPDAIMPLRELLNSLVLTFKDYRNEILTESFKHLLRSMEKIPERYDSGQVQPLLETMLDIYFDPGLWELSILMRGILSKYLEYHIDSLEDFIKTKSEDAEDVITLVAIYEILDIASKDINFVQEQKDNVIRKLSTTARGYLWLIDRLADSDPEKAFKLAKKGLSGGLGSVSSFRDRLITLHLKRNEPKQAAALSFIQFKDGPNFEEYLRLKTILNKNLNDFNIYLKQMQELLINSGGDKLLMEIMIDQGDYDSIIKHLPKITTEHSLLLLTAKLLSSKILERFEKIYPEIIRALLDDDSLSGAKAANSLLLAYKKLCFQKKDETGWEILREQLLQSQQTGLNLSKRTIAILNHR